MNEIFKIGSQLKMLVQKHSENFGPNIVQKGTYFTNSLLHCTLSVASYSIFFLLLILFENCIKHLEMNLQLLPALVTDITEFFCVALYEGY